MAETVKKGQKMENIELKWLCTKCNTVCLDENRLTAMHHSHHEVCVYSCPSCLETGTFLPLCSTPGCEGPASYDMKDGLTDYFLCESCKAEA